jgi:hypothetical protein
MGGKSAHDTVVAPLALDQQLGLGTLAHHEIHLAAIDVAKVSQFHIAPFHILLILHPLGQMARHQVLKSSTGAAPLRARPSACRSKTFCIRRAPEPGHPWLGHACWPCANGGAGYRLLVGQGRGVYPSRMTVVLNFDGKQLPREMRSLPSGRYILQSVDEVLALTAEEEAGLEEAASSLDRDEGFTPEEFRIALEGTLRR